MRIYLIGVQNLIVEVNVHYIKGMLANLDLTNARIFLIDKANSNADKEDIPPIKLTTKEPQELQDDNQTLIYNMILRSAKAQLEEHWLEKVRKWLINTKWPIGMEDKEYAKFICHL
ncbi:hypothetical protein C0995_002380 [Termitomyces sp. Mi166|nr:hypothetical protein C0995_002380 [Termitomyces sp. Mi166\